MPMITPNMSLKIQLTVLTLPNTIQIWWPKIQIAIQMLHRMVKMFNTVTLLGQSVERLRSNIDHEPNSYKDNDDLDDSNPGSLLVENTAERRNGSSYGSEYLHQFKDDKDCSSSSCSSSIHGPGELEDDSAQMVLRLSEDGNDSRSSLKRSRENSDEDMELKKLKTEQPIKNEECPAENTEQLCKKEEYKSEKTEQLTEVQNTTSVTDQTGKRTLEKEVNDSKRLKLDNTSSAIKNLQLFHQFMMRKSIRRLSRRDLEEFAVQKICESLNQHSEIAGLLREIRIKDRAFEALRAKYTTLQKQVTDLDIVQTRISNEMRKVKDPREVVPVKITRSVGLQVSLQPLKTKANLPALVPHVSDPLVPITVTGPAKKKPQRAAATANRVSVLPPPPPALTPAPAHIRPPPVPTGKGIKTILPKISNNGQMRDESNSLLGNILQKSPTSNNNAATATLRRPAGDNVKVIDLTDEDDSNRASTSTGTQSGNIRVVAPHQLTNSSSETVSPLVTTNIPRLTYLVQSPGQQGQSVLLATTNAPTRPGQARPTLMFKPVVPQGGQKMNLVRPAVPGGAVAVLPSSLGSSGVCKYVTTTYAPGLTRSPALSTRAIAPASRHPAPLPGPPAVQASQPSWKLLPPKPALKITLVGDGIVLSWRILNKDMSLYEEIASYQLYAYQETSAPPTTEMWRKVGDVKALALPMACTLTQFTDGNKYHFAVRGVDVKTRVGPFSTPEQITLPAQ
ncbi:windei [Carabus blaptoides fortunei]